MKWSSNRNWAARFGVVGLAFVLGASASAGTLYSWKTEDGTFAYTNDKKRIPTKYKAEAETSTLKSMGSYARFTPGPKTDGKAHGDRIVERLEVLRTNAGSAAGVEASSSSDGFVSVNVNSGRRNTGSEVNIPVGAAGDVNEPVVIEHVRMKPVWGSNTSRHFRVVKQGDRVLAIIKDRQADNPLTSGLDERDFDSN